MDTPSADAMIRFIVSMGIRAPSADNCQPWRFLWNGKTLKVLKDHARTGFFYDANEESTLITMGAVIENMRIAASHYGLKTDINFFPDGTSCDVIAELHFFPAHIVEDPLLPFIMLRCVNRNPYHKKRIEENVVEKLLQVAHDFPNTNIIWMDEERTKRIMRKIIFDADRILFEDSRLHAGLFQWIRLGKPGKCTADGMTLDVLGLNALEKKIFPRLADWRTLSLLNRFGASRAPGLKSFSLLKQSPAYCLLTVARREPVEYLKGGMMVERFWITANALGVSVQPMAGFIFLLNHLYRDGAMQFTTRHRLMIQAIRWNLNRILTEKTSLVPVMFFRLGYASTPTFRTSRRAVQEVFRKELP